MKLKKLDNKAGPKNASRCKRLHNVRFYNLSPRSIQCMAYSSEFYKLAISRADGSMEIWDMQDAPILQKLIPKTPGNSVDGLAWCGQRLFSAGISGELVEWNLQTMRPLHKQLVTGNSIWCLDVNTENSELALGTEEGYINVFDIVDGDNFQYKKLFDKQESRVLCCKYSINGEYLVSGSVGSIRIWNSQNGHCLNKITMPKAENGAEVIVWSLQITNNFNIIAGDSRGCITVWHGHNGSQLESHQALKADILTIAMNSDENLLICAGVEPIIKIFAKAQIKREDAILERWVKYLQRSVHDHDIKALVINGDSIYSGGMDGYLGMSSILRRKSEIAKFGPFLKNPCASVASESNLLLLQYPNYFEIWRLGKPDEANQKEKNNLVMNCGGNDTEMAKHRLDLSEEPRKLLDFKRKDGAPIVCCTISPDGRFCCYSTLNQTRIFALSHISSMTNERSDASIEPMNDLRVPFSGASHLKFSSDSKSLYLVSRQLRRIFVFTVDSGANSLSWKLCNSIEFEKHIKDDISHLAISDCRSYVVVAGTCRTISVWHLEKSESYEHYSNLPRYTSATTALSLHPNTPRLVVAFSDGKLIEYDLDEMCFTCAAHKHFVPSMSTHPIWNILLDANNPNIFILQNDSRLIVVEKKLPNASSADVSDGGGGGSKPKNPKKEKLDDVENQIAVLNLKSFKSYEHLIYVNWLRRNEEMVAISINPLSFIEQLPAAFKQKKYGVS